MVASRASLVYGFTCLPVYFPCRRVNCVPQLCAKGARTRYNGWEDGAQGVEVAGEWGKARAAVRGVRAMSCAIEANGVGSKGKMRRRSGKVLVRGLL